MRFFSFFSVFSTDAERVTSLVKLAFTPANIGTVRILPHRRPDKFPKRIRHLYRDRGVVKVLMNLVIRAYTEKGVKNIL